MAILNYAKTLGELKVNGGLPIDLRLIFTGDKHLITHGVDYLADYNGDRGLVPTYNVAGDYGILGKNGWTTLTTNYLPVNDSIISATNLWSSDKIAKYVADGFAANDAMVFKGVLGTVGEVTHALPSKDYSAGYTYRVVTAGTYAGKTCEVGDLIIAVKDYNKDTASENDWAVVQTNIDGASKVTINGISYDIYTKGTPKSDLTFVAPTAVGSNGDVLSTVNGSLSWVSQSSLNAGTLNGVAKEDLLTEVTASNGSISVTVGGTPKTATAAGNWNINAASANKVNKTLKTSGNGLSAVEFDGSSEKTITLLPATNSTLGGVIVSKPADNTTDSSDTISIKDGHIWLTEQNVINALGYKPENVANSVVVSTTTKGIAPKIEVQNDKISESFYFLAYNSGTTETEAKWYQLPTNSLGNSWRPIKLNNTALYDDKNDPDNVLNFVNGNLITITKATDNNNIIISTTAEVNQAAFSVINAGGTEISASAKTDTVKFTGTNVTVAGISADKTINFSVADFVGATQNAAGKKGLAPAPAAGDNLKFLRGDGQWVVPTDTNTWRKIIVGDTNLGNGITTGDLTIAAGKDISVALANNILTIASTYAPQIYQAGTGISEITSDKTTTFNLKNASADEIGGIKIGYNTNSEARRYAVQLDNNKAFVEVPWTDTNIRDIKIAGTSIGTATLNIIPSEDVVISWDKEADFADGEATISFGLSWYNITENKYETVQ